MGQAQVSHFQMSPCRNDLPTWYAIYTRSHHEKSVARRFEELRIEHFLPLYRSRRTWSCNRRIELSLPLFPNYLFVRMAPGDQTRVLSTPGVVMIVRSGPSAGMIDDIEIQQIKRYLSLCEFQPEPQVSAGTLVRITSGPLTGLVGNLIWRANSARVMLLVSSIGQGASVEVLVDQIAPVLKPRASHEKRSINPGVTGIPA